MKSEEIREKFLKFFEERGHARVASSSLIPANDPTLLFSNAGMNQFKDTFIGRETRDYKVAASSQKCVRAGGKHNDLDNVGYTARHHTFFEMLGNFSFGDYFKEKAIAYSWEFLTQVLAIPTDRLYVTVYTEDDEAYNIWRDQVGVPENRIFRFGKKDNFWAMGDTGPCGPCSEIFYDYGDAVPGPKDPFEAIESGSDRIVEVWNLVFMQYDSLEDGSLVDLPNPSIDTGMGLERICSVMQGCTTNYDTDLFQDIIKPVAAFLKIEQGQDAKKDTALRVIADHLRAMAFLIADGVVPSSEGRGYVLRRIMRRAMRFGKQLGQEEPFLHNMVDHVIEKMKGHYPELEKEKPQIELLVKVEENQFDKTLSKGMPILTRYLDDFTKQGVTQVPGQIVHFLYDTHGFPVDLMEDIARDWNMTLNHKEFKELIEAGAQNSADFSAKKINPILEEDAQNYETLQTCYDGLEGSGLIRRILVDEQAAESIIEGQKAVLVMDSTSFYAESGGQIGDKGEIRGLSGVFKVETTTKVLDKLVLHEGQVVNGSLKMGDQATTHVDKGFRRNTIKNHTATHLLHQALRDVLGLHVRQAGSLVDPEKLRFDFSHFAPLTPENIADLEDAVNQRILENIPVETQVLGREDAMNSGAIAFFGEKYGETVRVVGVGDYSKEFCGGAHVSSTGEIGCFKIVSERGLAAGIRRMIALTGPKAFARFQESEALLKTAQDKFFLNRETLIEQLQQGHDDRKRLEKQVEDLKMQLAKGGSAEDRIEEINGYKVMLKKVTDVDGGQLRQLADEMLGKIKDGVVMLGSDLGEKAQLIVKTNRKEVHAGNLVREMAAMVGGKGGGRPDMAMAGGKDASKIEEALEKGLSILNA